MNRTKVISLGSPGALRKRMIENAPARLKARATLLPMSRMMTATITGSRTIVSVKLCE
ncbi:hypothetical protein D3C75_1371460 [compost metagenome]